MAEDEQPHREDAGLEPTAHPAYAARLRDLERRGVRRYLDVQAPYRWNLHRLRLGRVLDVGSGLGRNLVNLGSDSVGVDHNPDSVAIARSRGLRAFTSDEFAASRWAVPESFDGLLFAHVLEHMNRQAGLDLIATYLPYLRPGGQACFITPQERGYASDATHIRFVDFVGLADAAETSGLRIERRYSFPFPRAAGRVFVYNEFVLLASWVTEATAE